MYSYSTIKVPKKITKKKGKEVSSWINAFILSRISDSYKHAVADMETPAAMLKKLENLAQPIIPQARFTIKRYLVLFSSMFLSPSASKEFKTQLGASSEKKTIHDELFLKSRPCEPISKSFNLIPSNFRQILINRRRIFVKLKQIQKKKNYVMYIGTYFTTFLRHTVPISIFSQS